MTSPREIQKQVTRPTSAVVMMLFWEAFISLFPNAMNQPVEDGVGKLILAVGLTGVIDKVIRNKDEIKEFFKSIFTKKKEEVKHDKS